MGFYRIDQERLEALVTRYIDGRSSLLAGTGLQRRIFAAAGAHGVLVRGDGVRTVPDEFEAGDEIGEVLEVLVHIDPAQPPIAVRLSAMPRAALPAAVAGDIIRQEIREFCQIVNMAVAQAGRGGASAALRGGRSGSLADAMRAGR